VRFGGWGWGWHDNAEYGGKRRRVASGRTKFIIDPENYSRIYLMRLHGVVLKNTGILVACRTDLPVIRYSKKQQ